MKKGIPVFLAVLIMFPFHFASASLVINEIMYDLSGSDSTLGKAREWIEIYNPDSNVVSVDASKWRIYDGSGNRTINGEVNFFIPAGAYIILAGDKDTFITDHAGFSGTVYDTGITSLNNTGATLKILNQDGEVVDLVTYASSQGGVGDGNSLQKISSTWQGRTPTQGAVNEVTSATNSSEEESSNSTTDNSTATSQTKSKTTEEIKIKTKIITKTPAFVGIPLEFKANTTGYSLESLFYGRYFWNFGDGDSVEIKMSDMNNQKFTHTYFYEGEYNINLEYYLNNYGIVPDASFNMTIKVVPAEISVSRVGGELDFFVELSNNTDYDIDLSNWILRSDTKSFVFPRNTMLGSKDKLMISSYITKFSVADKDTLKLMTPQGKIAFDYGASVVVPVSSVAIPTIKTSPQPLSIKKDGEGQRGEVDSEISLIPAPENLPASAISSDVTVSNPMRAYLLTTIMTVFLGISAGAVYFIRRKKIKENIMSSAGDDFEILDE